LRGSAGRVCQAGIYSEGLADSMQDDRRQGVVTSWDERMSVIRVEEPHGPDKSQLIEREGQEQETPQMSDSIQMTLVFSAQRRIWLIRRLPGAAGVLKRGPPERTGDRT